MTEPRTETPVLAGKSYLAGSFFKTINLAICLIAIGIVFIIFHLRILDKVELLTLDLRYKLRGLSKGSEEIVLVDIDEASLNHVGEWPWSREWHTLLITTLAEYNSKVTAFDIFFSEPSPLVDLFLIGATQKAQNVVYALAFASGPSEQKVLLSQAETDVLKKFSLPDSRIIGDKNKIPQYAIPITPLPELYNAAKTAGHVVAIPDPDGVMRRIPSVIECQGSYYLNFSLETALAYLGLNRNNLKISLGQCIDLGNGIKIPIDEKGFIMINWAGPWRRDFRHYSFWEVIMSYQKLSKGENSVIKPDEFKNKICIVGLTAIGLMDIKPMPLEPGYPSVGIHSNIVNSILTKKFIKEAKPPVNLILILLLVLPMGFIIPKLRPLWGFITTAGFAAGFLLISYLLFKFAGLWINNIYPIFGISISYISLTIHTEIANAIERTRLFNLAVEDGLTKLYVVRHFKEMLEREMSTAKRYSRPLSLIISDIDHFKRINDTYGHLAGDFILKEIANIFKSSCREADIAGRYGGEEFVILLPETRRDGAIEFAERLRKLIESLVLEYNNIKFNITISFGVTEFKDDASTADFIKRADEALYVAKETGRNKVCFG